MKDLHLFVTLLFVLVIIIAVSRFVGYLCLRIGQPRVLGEMIAGVLLGPTLFGALAPDLHAILFSADIKMILYMLSNLGLALYMFLVGAELNFGEFDKRFYKSSVALASAGFITPFVSGIFLALLLHSQFSKGGNWIHFSLFIAIAISMTAFPMLARIFQERKLMNSKIANITLLAASIIDAFGWITLAIVTALVTTDSVRGGLIAAGGAVVFMLVLLTIVKPLVNKLGKLVEERGTLSQGHIGIILVLVLSAAAITDYIGVYSVFGGFMLGVVMPKNQKFQSELRSKLEDIVVVFLVPIFFTYSGINTSFSTLNYSLFIAFLAILLIAVASKYAGCLFVMKRMGFGWRESSAIGSLMNARGLMELIVLNVGLAYGIIPQELFSLLVWMAIITTALAMPLYNLSFSFKTTTKKLKQQLKAS
ncbi:cation:proton antiporter [Bacillus sp. S10(2024)]|uniref:cation:proton antiporter domain-containing protein n=1 Tax=Bacillus sp. S10(2024) TaxID=3162886 RepID=UPI003D19AAE2